MTATCPKCHKKYRLGYNGVLEGCDKCLKIQRDRFGHAWFPGEKTHTYRPNDGGPVFTRTREEAFRH